MSTNGTLEFNGTSQSVSGSMFKNRSVKDLIVTSGGTGLTVSSTAGDTLNILESLTFGNTTSGLITGGNITLKSGITATASVGTLAPGNSINGDVTVERYIATGTASPDHPRSWQFLGIPTQGQTIHQSWQENCAALVACITGHGTQITGSGSGFDASSAAPAMKTYDYASNNYIGVSGTGIPIYNQKGYFIYVKGDRTVTSSFGTATETVLRTKGTLFTPTNKPPSTLVNANSFESVGNPYASAIDMRKIGRTGDVLPVFIVWDPRLGS